MLQWLFDVLFRKLSEITSDVCFKSVRKSSDQRFMSERKSSEKFRSSCSCFLVGYNSWFDCKKIFAGILVPSKLHIPWERERRPSFYIRILQSTRWYWRQPPERHETKALHVRYTLSTFLSEKHLQQDQSQSFMENTDTRRINFPSVSQLGARLLDRSATLR